MANMNFFTTFQTIMCREKQIPNIQKTEEKRPDGLMTYKEFCDTHPEFKLMLSLAFNPVDEYNKYLTANGASPIEKNDIFSINKNKDYKFDPSWLYC